MSEIQPPSPSNIGVSVPESEIGSDSQTSAKRYGDKISVLFTTKPDSGSIELPANQALDIFRQYLLGHPRAAVEYIVTYLDLDTAEGILADDVALMFFGALFQLLTRETNHSSQIFSFDEWQNLARDIAEKKKAKKYSTASRVALCAAIISCVCVIAENSSDIAKQLIQLHHDIDGRLRASAPGEENKADFLLSHLLHNMDGLRFTPDSQVSQFLGSLTKSE